MCENSRQRVIHISIIAAAYNGDDRLVELLLENGADPKAVDRTGKTAMLYAAGRGFAGIVGMLHAAGVDVNLALGNDLTALMWAAGFSNDVPPTEGLATVSLLLGLGAEVNRRDNRGRTALMTAAERDYAEVVDALVKAGAKPGIEDNEGKTARDLASAAGSLDAIKALGAAGSAKP